MTHLIQMEMAKYNFALEMSKLFQSWMKKKEKTQIGFSYGVTLW